MRFKYQALDAQGQELNGTLEAASLREAARQLQQRELRVLQLGQAESSKTQAAAGKPKPRDILMVLHELTTLLESEVSLIEAVESLAESSHPPVLIQAFADMAAKLRQGENFSSALRAAPLGLPWYLTQLVEAGELTGKLAQALRDGVAQMEYEARVRDEMRNAMIYPVILVLSGIAAVLLIFIVVVPRFANILKNRHAEDIPWLAKAVINSGMFLNEHLVLLGSAALGAVFFAVYFLRQPQWRARFQDGLSRLPLLGVWIMEAETGRWAAMLGTLLENRVALLHALDLARQGVQLPSLRARLDQVSKAVRGGIHLSQALHDNDAITPTGHNLVRAGERAGELPRLLKSLARLYEESGRVRMKRLLLLIEPAAILIIGGVIGVIITGVILAITSVNTISL